jgi:ketosteroid isomerase-like protein
MNTPDPILVVLQFNECINGKDLEKLSGLMTDDHEFIDRTGHRTASKAQMVLAWKRFFESFPEYHNVFDRVETKGNMVMILGHAAWSKEKPYDPVIWSAVVVDNRVRQWRIYEDTPEIRRAFCLD